MYFFFITSQKCGTNNKNNTRTGLLTNKQCCMTSTTRQNTFQCTCIILCGKVAVYIV